jgi:hypothetical protein
MGHTRQKLNFFFLIIQTVNKIDNYLETLKHRLKTLSNVKIR